MTYRRELESAHARIAELERQIAERDKKDLPPPAAPPLPPKTPTRTFDPWAFLHAWPLVSLVGALGAYGIAFGTSLPWGLSADADLWRAGLLMTAAGSALMTIRLVLWLRNDRASSPVQRLLM